MKYSFENKDIFLGLDKKIISRYWMPLRFKDEETRKIASEVFTYCLYLILLDVINNNSIFVLPLRWGNYAELHLKEIPEERFKELYNAGCFQEIDYVLSNFTAKVPVLTYRKRNGFYKDVQVHLYGRFKQDLIDCSESQSNNRCVTKTLDDYIDRVKKRYTYINIKVIEKILNYGFNAIYRLLVAGADVRIKNDIYSFFCGRVFYDEEERKKYIRYKQSVKLRMSYKYKCIDYNGLYYFGLTEDEYEKFNENNRKIKNIPVILYKIKEEIFLNKKYKYFYSMTYPIDCGWVFRKNKINKNECIYMGYRDSNDNIILT